MTLQQRQPVVPAVFAASFFPSQLLLWLSPSFRDLLDYLHSSHALSPPTFLKGLIDCGLRIFKLYMSISHGLVRVS